jgi:hypothetical protein
LRAKELVDLLWPCIRAIADDLHVQHRLTNHQCRMACIRTKIGRELLGLDDVRPRERPDAIHTFGSTLRGRDGSLITTRYDGGRFLSPR